MEAKEMLEVSNLLVIGDVSVAREGDDFDFVITNLRTKHSVRFTSDEGFLIRDIINQMDNDTEEGCRSTRNYAN